MITLNTESGITVVYDDTDGTIDFTVASQTDQNFTNADHTKLDGIEANATADQTASEIRTLVQAASDSNVFTDDDQNKLDNIETNADVTDTANVVGALTAGANISIANDGTISSSQISSEQVQDIVGAMITLNTESGITVVYDDTDGTIDFTVASQTDQNFTNADHTKLDGIEANATADQTASEIRTLVQAASDSNVFTDDDQNKLDNIETNADVTDTANVLGALSVANTQLGIGTSSPSSALHVSSSSTVATFQSSNSKSIIALLDDGADVNLISNSGTFHIGNASTDLSKFMINLGNGRVGIGTSSPDELFHIEGSATTLKAKIESTGSNSYPTLRLTNDARSYDLQIDGATDSLRIYDPTATAERFRITSSGNVGIGASVPSSLLHLASAGPAVLTIEADTDNATETDNAGIVLKQDGGIVVGRIGYENNTNALEFVNVFNDSLSLGTNNTKRLTINGSGYANFTSRVGIGIDSPEQELHVYQGTAKFESTDGNDVSLQLGRSDVANLWNFNHAGNDLRVYNAGGSGYDVLFGVNSGGTSQSNKVGINTGSPSHQLDVNGTFRSVGDATFDANVNATGVITTGGNTAAEVMSWLHVGRMWTFNGLPGFSGDSGTFKARSDGNVPALIQTGAAASRRAMATLIRNTYNDYGGFSGAGADYSRAIGVSIKAAFVLSGEDSCRARLLVGSDSTLGTYADEDPLSSHGFGVEFRRGSGTAVEWRVFAHNGTSLTASTFTSTGISNSMDPRTVAVYSDGSGNITAYTATYGTTSYTTATTTGGPTTTAGGMSKYTSIQVATNDSNYVSGAQVKLAFMGARFYAE